MALIKASSEIYDLKDANDKFRYIQLFLSACKDVVNGSLEFQKNLIVNPVSVTFQSANTNLTIAHGLGRVPRGYLIVAVSADMTIYGDSVDINTIATATNISLKSSAAGNAKILFL